MSKVILLSSTPPPIGGIAAWTVRMLNTKLPNSWEVGLVDEKIIGNREIFGNKTRINVRLEVKRCLGIWKGLKKALKDTDVKVVHACLPANTLPVLRELVNAYITKNRRRVFITHFRCTVPNMINSKLNVLAVKALCRKSDCVMLLNSESVNYIESISKTKTVLIPNFVDTEELSSNHVIRDKIQRVIYVGGVIESKGCLDIIEVAKSFPDIEFVLVGNPEEKCVRLAESVSNVKIKGALNHNDIKRELDASDVFMFLTYFRGEGFSNSLAEAMAAGLPCIVSDWAANKDMIEDKGGIVVPVHGVNEAIEALKSVKSYDVRMRQSEFNINKVKLNYSDEVVQRQYVQCYEELIK